jgi:glycosyltransferase involved in cell wall biosynthesis
MGQEKSVGDGPSTLSHTVLLSANSFWNIRNFRDSLIGALATKGYRIIIAAPDADIGWARENGVEAVEIAIDRAGLNPLSDGRLFFDYLRLFDRYTPDFYLCYTAKPNIYGSLAARLAGASSLPNVSGLGTAFINQGPLSRFVGLLYRLAFRGCPIVFFQNPDDRDLFLARRIVTPGQAQLLPGSGVDLDRFAVAPSPEAGAPRFLFMGRLLGDKGVREFVEAARLLKAGHPSWRFQLLGALDEGNRSGVGASELQSWVEHGIIEHLGHADDVRPQIAAATAIVLPSYREGLPRSLLEAAAMGRPLVASNVPGNRQLIEHGVNGLLCEARSAQSLAEAIREIGLMDEDQRRRMGLAGRELVERSYSEELVIQAYLDALAQLAPAARV